MQHSVAYTIIFAAIVCVICAVLVSSSAVSLEERQVENAALDKQKNVLYAAGLATADEGLDRDAITALFENVKPVVIDLETGQEVANPDFDPSAYNAIKAAAGEQGRDAPRNPSRVSRLPKYQVVYQVLAESGDVEMVVIPIEGYGLWGTLYGFLALDSDATTVRGITYYQHKETPGLGGEVDNANWKSLWPGRKAFDDSGTRAIQVIKGNAGPPSTDPHRVDGLAGATITSRGVTNMLDFWLGANGFGPYLKQLRDAHAG